MILRDERGGDEEAIGAITAAAFADMPYSDQTEPAIIERLRAAGALAVSLVAEEAGEIVGHVALSSVSLSSGQAGWYAIGPISVRPDRQKAGIGSELMHAVIARARGMDAQGIILAGDPGYYHRFGFASTGAITADGIPTEYLLSLALREETPSGIVTFHPGFYGPLPGMQQE